MRSLLTIENGKEVIYSEDTLQGNEAKLHQIIETHPELIPYNELDFLGPFTVVYSDLENKARLFQDWNGRPDIIFLSTAGEIVITELKSGSANETLRDVLAQVQEYGTRLFKDYPDTESFCNLCLRGLEVRAGTKSMSALERLTEEAGKRFSTVQGIEDKFMPEDFQGSLAYNITKGDYKYLIVSGDIPGEVGWTMEMLERRSSGKVFTRGLEIGYYRNGEREVFVPVGIVPRKRSRERTTIQKFLEGCATPATREAFDNLFRDLKGLGFKLYPGPQGFSVRKGEVSVLLLYNVSSGAMRNDKVDIIRILLDQLQSKGIPTSAIKNLQDRLVSGGLFKNWPKEVSHQRPRIEIYDGFSPDKYRVLIETLKYLSESLSLES